MRRVALSILVSLMGLFLSQMTGCGQPTSQEYGEESFSKEELAKLNLRISISLVNRKEGARLHFRHSFVMPRESLLIKLPDTFLRKEHLYDLLEQLKVSAGAQLLPYPNEESVKVLKASKGKRVELTYLVKPNIPDHRGGINKESFSAPIIRDNYFQFVGMMTLLYPIALVSERIFSLTMEWDLPPSFQIFDSFGANTKVQSISTNFDRLRDAFFVGGSNMRIDKTQIRGRSVFVVFEGRWDHITDRNFVDTLQKLLSEQRKTWRDEDYPYFLVSLLSTPSKCNGHVKFAGTAHPNSFRAIFPSGCALMPEMKQLISHELMHMWIGKKIRVGKARGHIDGKWFTEGWTDFFGRTLAYRAGVITLAEYFTTLNRQLEKYYISPERLAPLSSLSRRMYRRGYSNRSLEDLPYQQGEIMALRLDEQIRKASAHQHSLDDVIRDMLRMAEEAGGSKNFELSEIEEIVDHYLPGAFRREYSKIVNGELLVPPTLDGCNAPESSSITQFTKPSLQVSTSIVRYGDGGAQCAMWLD